MYLVVKQGFGIIKIMISCKDTWVHTNLKLAFDMIISSYCS